MDSLSPSQPNFHLTRHFSLAALLTIVIAALVLGQVYRHFAEQHLLHSEERHNTELTQYFAALIWPEYGPFLTRLQGQNGDAIRHHPLMPALHDAAVRLIRGSRIVKLKIFDRTGLTVYSSELAQIGADKSAYAGFQAATRGAVQSTLSFRDRVYHFANETELQNRSLLSSYAPVYGANGLPEGVIELYNDITPLLDDIQRTHLQVILATIAVMLLLYSALFLIVRRADHIIRDKTEAQLQNERQIHHQANHDALTGLPNRRYFRQLLGHCMANAQHSEHLIAVLFVDLDRFKPINDSLGHQVGDQVLKVVAGRLRSACRDGDIVSRFGGDEFTVILDHLDHVQSIERAARRIIDTISRPVQLADKEFAVGASVGIAIYPFDDQDIDELIRHADTAMYHAKESGRNCYRFYSEEMNADAVRRMELERELRQALRDQQFEIHYQPRLDMRQQRVTAVEALLRWRHPERGLVGPDQFIPMAEESGLILPIGYWVLEEASRQIAALTRTEFVDLNLSVNVSARQFEDAEFARKVRHAVRASGLTPQRLELELTETMLMRSRDECVASLEVIKDIGVRLSLDDFGTGYSSLSYLKHLPLDVLKIDRSFICDVTDNPRNAALASAIAGLGRKLDMQVVAEGVETAAQLAFVENCQCHEVQGYLIARPMPLDALQQFLRQQQPARSAG